MIQRATRSVYVVFILAGVVISSFLSRVPQIRDLLELEPGPLGRLLLMTAIGSLISLPLSGLIVHRLGAARTVTLMAFVSMSGLGFAAVGTEVSAIMVGAGLVFFGFGAGAWDVAMNVEAAAVEQQLDRSIMSRFHAAFSVGTVGGALVGAGANALDIAPIVHLLVVVSVVVVTVPVMCRGFMPAGTDEHEEQQRERSPFAAWTERRTVLIGLFVLCITFAEGTGNDWLGVASIDGYGTSDALGSVAYVVFVLAMTLGRWFGPGTLDRFGRVPVLRVSAACAFVGVVIVVFGPSFGTALVGIVLWGLGTALGFPTGMSAAADDPQYAAGRVSVVATVGYVAFLAGPSLIGFIGDHTGVLRALTLTAAVLGLGFMVAGATKPLVPATGPTNVPADDVVS